MELTYSIQTDSYGHRWIKCLVCGMGSYHIHDIEHHYCAYCHRFHEEMMRHVEKAEIDGTQGI